MEVCSKNKKRTEAILIVVEGEKLIATLRTRYDNNEEEFEEQSYNLREVSKEELFALRLSQIPGFVLKKDNTYYYAKIPNDLRFVCQNIVEKHCCNACQCFSAQKENGCPKVQDLSITSYSSEYRTNPEILDKAKRIEKYDFITLGIESFNTMLDSFVVGECKNHEKVTKRPRLDLKREATLKLSLAQYVWPNASTLEESERFSSKYHIKKSQHNTSLKA